MTESKPMKPHRRIFYSFAPLLLLIICLAGINFINWWRQQSQASEMEAKTAVSTQISDQQANNPATPLPTPLPTITPIPSATPYTPPTFSSETQIQLLGPPESALFIRQQPLSFYWQWPLPLADDQFFTITLFFEDESLELGAINEPNLGTNFQWQQNLNAIPLSVDMIQWQVNLFSEYNETPLLVSDVRSISLR